MCCEDKRKSFGEVNMFNSLDDEFKKVGDTVSTRGEQMIRYSVVALLSVLAFGGIFVGVWLLEY